MSMLISHINSELEKLLRSSFFYPKNVKYLCSERIQVPNRSPNPFYTWDKE